MIGTILFSTSTGQHRCNDRGQIGPCWFETRRPVAEQIATAGST